MSDVAPKNVISGQKPDAANDLEAARRKAATEKKQHLASIGKTNGAKGGSV